VAAGTAVAVAAVGTYFGLKSKSEIDSAESAYRNNGNAWTSSDLDTLNSGNSKAKTANVLFIASGILLAASAGLILAF
jgi:predicted neuraminidase